ncbi:MAG: glycosyltransferase family 2 protein [Mesorhizobium sp.]|uniref:glycosyltransferase family 2 protein n=1 Tax=Mesorhizobium sp. TaxID=1871066 RepID=UPI000FE7E8E4|nr:glycosyltransferase family 2 protein [Mesorhizobium sp.]RWM99611.1 MAG: glycosyltransferase family 2 protein [Mesorhizobium sp.]
MTVISICIPTYNRSRMLAELLDSIVAQRLQDDIEVVISDDASPDDTVAVAESYRKKIKHFKLIAQPSNLGLDRNFLAVTAAATGDYIWLMGDDDRLEPGGARRVLDALKHWPQIVGLTLGVIDYDVRMEHPVGIREMPPTQVMIGASEVFSRIADLLGFMSALVVKRDLWEGQARDPAVQAIDNYYVQVLILGRVIAGSGQWGVLREPCVGFRTDNDQFNMKLGWLNRLKVDIRAYDELADTLFADDPTAHAAMRDRVFETHVMARIVNAKTAAGHTPEIARAIGLLMKAYGSKPRFWMRAVPILIAPKWSIRQARTLYKRFSRFSGTARARRLAHQTHGSRQQ